MSQTSPTSKHNVADASPQSSSHRDSSHASQPPIGEPARPNMQQTSEVSPSPYRYAYWTAAFVAAVITLVASLSVDIELSNRVRGLKVPGDVQKAINLCETVAHGSGCFAILASLLWIDQWNRHRLWRAAFFTAICGITSNLAKYSIPRIRPNALMNQDPPISSSWDTWGVPLSGSWFDEASRSFPSGHSATAVALAIGLSHVYPRGRWIFAMLACGACFQRLFAGAHYLSDIMGGVAISIAFVPLIYRRHRHSKASRDQSPESVRASS